MLPVHLQTPRDFALALARRVKALRLERGWTQEELAVVLDARHGFDHLFAAGPATSLAELEQRARRPARKRGRRSDA